MNVRSGTLIELLAKRDSGAKLTAAELRNLALWDSSETAKQMEAMRTLDPLGASMTRTKLKLGFDPQKLPENRRAALAWIAFIRQGDVKAHELFGTLCADAVTRKDHGFFRWLSDFLKRDTSADSRVILLLDIKRQLHDELKRVPTWSEVKRRAMRKWPQFKSCSPRSRQWARWRKEPGLKNLP